MLLRIKNVWFLGCQYTKTNPKTLLTPIFAQINIILLKKLTNTKCFKNNNFTFSLTINILIYIS